MSKNTSLELPSHHRDLKITKAMVDEERERQLPSLSDEEFITMLLEDADIVHIEGVEVKQYSADFQEPYSTANPGFDAARREQIPTVTKRTVTITFTEIGDA